MGILPALHPEGAGRIPTHTSGEQHSPPTSQGPAIHCLAGRTMAEWRIRRREGPAIGPFETQRVLRAIRAGKVPYDSHAQRVGQQSWTPITRIPEFSHVFAEPTEVDLQPIDSVSPPSGTPPLPWDEEEDEATRLMVQVHPSSGARQPPVPVPMDHTAEPFADLPPPHGALHPVRLPPKPALPGARVPPEALPPVEELRDAVEDDDADMDPRFARLATSPHDELPSTMAVALPPHLPGEGRSAARRPSGGPDEHLPSISVHPDHDQTSPARRALTSTPEQVIRRLTVVVIVLSVALFLSLLFHAVH